jgi:hypothetical protein
MLEFAVRPYLELAHKFGLLLAVGKQPDPNVVRDVWSDLVAETNRLDLPITRELIACLFEDFARANPKKLSIDKEGFRIVGAELPLDRMAHHCESIYKTLTAELNAVMLRVIPKEKTKYCDPKWLADSILYAKFPDTIEEFQKAGRCYAYGENTACVFHLMRVCDFCLRKVADSLNVSYDARNWHGIADKISKTMEQKYQLKKDEWKKQEPFYAEILTDIQAIGRGHRNAALHELEQKYDEREALYMLTVIESFARRCAVIKRRNGVREI